VQRNIYTQETRKSKEHMSLSRVCSRIQLRSFFWSFRSTGQCQNQSPRRKIKKTFSSILISFFRKAEACEASEPVTEVINEVDYDASLSETEQAELEERVNEWLQDSRASFASPVREKMTMLGQSESNPSIDMSTDEIFSPMQSWIHVEYFIPYSQSLGRSKSL
jgi:hypothetical protein